MAKIKLKGTPLNTVGELPRKGENGKDFMLVKNDLSRVKLYDFKNLKKEK
ncbi:MAG: hypothetical protein PHN68_05655 [Prolixibacteraceae bacterium]|nr:hypothetical protein [Prolixibacteraceae bacterium]MDD4755739.1 hypothetical protein [Prolixibacteraceae bacterium]